MPRVWDDPPRLDIAVLGQALDTAGMADTGSGLPPPSSSVCARGEIVFAAVVKVGGQRVGG